MLSIGEFSNICQVSTKTLRYYAEIDLILPDEINPGNGYRYYSIDQLEKMLFINRLKSYHFSLDEIKTIINSEGSREEYLCIELNKKKKEIEKQLHSIKKSLCQLDEDISNLKQGRSIMSYLRDIEVQLVEVPPMRLISIRKTVTRDEMKNEYSNCFGVLLKKIKDDNLTPTSPPMTLFHSAEFSPVGLDIELAIPVKESACDTRNFTPGLSLKTVLYGSYSELASVYTKQRSWAEKEGYISSNALFEVYITDPSQVKDESELETEIYYPVKKKQIMNCEPKRG